MATHPTRRIQGLSFRAAGAEMLVHDSDTGVVHLFQPELASVWRAIDAAHDLDTVARFAKTTPASAAQAIQRLDELNLLEAGTGFDRRMLLRRGAILGAGVVGTPILSTILLPALAAATGTPVPYNLLSYFDVVSTNGTFGPFTLMEATSTTATASAGFTQTPGFSATAPSYTSPSGNIVSASSVGGPITFTVVSGTAKYVGFSFTPPNATNTSVLTYVTSSSDKVYTSVNGAPGTGVTGTSGTHTFEKGNTGYVFVNATGTFTTLTITN